MRPLYRATVITDASWCPFTSAGGWAVWMTAGRGFNDPDKFTLKKYGQFNKLPKSATEAEKWACYNGLWFAAAHGVESALIQTDCLSLVQSRQSDYEEHRQEYWPNMEVEWRHVKGHTDRPESRFYVNRWCDEKAGIMMNRQRKYINGCRKRNRQGNR